ncbi:MAG: hypothetical protein EXX96DRAFT_612798 [Benjaminiella poitrasii]|nr:MAG: hypothetical protein EXX96DRAFT_612798 [Benjaminiella poitrasii]
MSHNWAGLSTEIVQLIFNYVADVSEILDQDYSNFQLVCKSWSLPAQIALYSSVNLKNTTTLQKFCQTIESSPSKPGRHVEDLKLYCANSNFENYVDITPQTYHVLAKFCPNVVFINMNDPDKIFWTSLHTEKMLGGWQKLEYFPSCENMELKNEYALTMLAFRDKIYSVSIEDNLGNFNPKNGGKYEFQNNILFRNLGIIEHLSFLGLNVGARVIDIYQLDVLFLMLYLQRRILNCLQSRPLVLTSREKSEALFKIKPCTNIAELQLNIPLNVDADLEYIMQKFPNIKTLNLNTKCRKELLFQMYKRIGRFTLEKEAMLRFINYLLKLDQFNTYLVINNFKDFIEQLFEAKKHNHVTFIIASIPLGRLFSHNCFHKNYSPDDPYLAPSIFNVTGSRKDNEYAYQFTSYVDEKRPLHMQPSVTETIEEFGYVMDTLKVDYGKVEGAEWPKPFDLDTLFNQCTKLSRLIIKNVNLKSLDGNLTSPLIINDTITRLDLIDCYMDSDNYYQLSMRLPSLKALHVNDDRSDLARRSWNSIIFNLSFTSLECFEYSVKNFNEIQYSKLFLKVDSSTTGTSFYSGEVTSKIANCTLEEFTDALRSKNETYLIYEISCKSIRRFDLKDDGLSGTFKFDESGNLYSSYITMKSIHGKGFHIL